MILRSKIGMFVGPDGIKYYRCIVSNVDWENKRVYAAWLGIPAPHDITNFRVNYRIDEQCSGRTVDPYDLEYVVCSVGKHRYDIWVPYNLKRKDEIIVNLR
jgi:hypothetical protein